MCPAAWKQFEEVRNMENNYQAIITTAQETGGLLDAMLACQNQDGYLTEAAINALADAFGMFPASVYETASFYTMLRLSPPAGKIDIRICRGAPCHVAGASAVIAAIEQALDVKIGHATPDGTYFFGYTECLGQCQHSPALLINGKLHTELTPTSAVELIRKEGAASC